MGRAFIFVAGILEVVQGRDDGASRTTCAAILDGFISD